MNKLQILSIDILNSKYRVVFTVTLYLIIYSFFYSDSIAFCMRSSNIPVIAESKDEIIRNLQKKVNDLTIEKDFLRKNIADVIKDSYDTKQRHLTEMQKLHEEVFDLRFKHLIPLQAAQGISLPTISHAEPIAEVSTSSDVVAISINEENVRLRAELKKTIEDTRFKEEQLKKQIADQHRTIQELRNQKQLLEEKFSVAENKTRVTTVKSIQKTEISKTYFKSDFFDSIANEPDSPPIFRQPRDFYSYYDEGGRSNYNSDSDYEN